MTMLWPRTNPARQGRGGQGACGFGSGSPSVHAVREGTASLQLQDYESREYVQSLQRGPRLRLRRAAMSARQQSSLWRQ